MGEALYQQAYLLANQMGHFAGKIVLSRNIKYRHQPKIQLMVEKGKA